MSRDEKKLEMKGLKCCKPVQLYSDDTTFVQGEFLSGLVKFELNSLKMPMFSLTGHNYGKKDTITFQETFRTEIDGNITIQTARLAFTPLEGLGGEFDYRAFRTIEQKLLEIKDKNGSLPQVVNIGSPTDILKAMGYTRAQRTNKVYNNLSLFFKKIVGYTFISENFYVVKNGNKQKSRINSGTKFGLYKKYMYKEEDDESGETTGEIRIELDDAYLQNLNNKNLKLLKSDVYCAITNDVARRVYELLTLRDKYLREGIKYSYSNFCTLMQIKQEKYKSLVIRQITNICKPLAEGNDPILKKIPTVTGSGESMVVIFSVNPEKILLEKKNNHMQQVVENALQSGISAKRLGSVASGVARRLQEDVEKIVAEIRLELGEDFEDDEYAKELAQEKLEEFISNKLNAAARQIAAGEKIQAIETRVRTLELDKENNLTDDQDSMPEF